MKFTLLLGGVVFDAALGDQPDILSEYAKIIRRVRDEGHEVSVVTGGGKLARVGIERARNLGANKSLQDEVGISATRLHALLMISALGGCAYPTVPTTYEEFRRYHEGGKVVVSGGMVPGQSTDAVAAVITEMIGGDLMIKGTGVDGVREIRADGTLGGLIPRISYERLEDLLRRYEQSPGRYELLDLVALKVLRRSGIKLIIYNGLRPSDLERILGGENVGTVVEGDPT